MKIILLFFVLFASYAYAKDAPVEKYVISDKGLILRSEPKKESGKICVIPYGEKVTVVEESTNSESLFDNYYQKYLDGNWTKIAWKNKRGWVFGGYLLEDKKFYSLKLSEYFGHPIKSVKSFLKNYNIFEAGLFKYYGKPVKAETNFLYNNYYTNSMDLAITYYFKTFTFCGIHIVNSGSGWINWIKIHKKTASMFKINIGLDTNDIVNELGAPGKIEDDSYIYIYREDAGFDAYLHLDIENGKIKTIRINYPSN